MVTVMRAVNDASGYRGRSRALRRATIAIVLLVFAGSCDSHSPTSPGPDTLTITCPVPPPSVVSPDGAPVHVALTTPTTVGGTDPVSLSCKPLLDGLFPVGMTYVRCTAVDAGKPAQAASCSLSVTVTLTATPPPRLSVTRFMAFGDSITEGKVGVSASETPQSYTNNLRALLAARYVGQQTTVLNEGSGGEQATGTGVDRFKEAFATDHPQVVLLQEGTNDLNNQDPNGPSPKNVQMALSEMADYARARGVPVILSTIPPLRAPEFGQPRVVPTNDLIRPLEHAPDLIVIDLYATLGGDPAGPLIGADGKHPTAGGYQIMAQLFFDAIQKRFEIPPMAPAFFAH